MIIENFKHKMAAHCESGTITSLLNHAGLQISEPLVFGISSGLFFGYFHKMKSFPNTTFIVRNKPGQMRKNIAKRLGVKFTGYSFHNNDEGQRKLDDLLKNNIPTAAQVDFFYLDYVPIWERVHINVHFIVVIGKEEEDYIISDCYFPERVRLKSNLLDSSRFAGGSMSPKGYIFHITGIPSTVNYEAAIIKGIKKVCFNMLHIPIPFLGVKGIRLFAKKIVEWPQLTRDNEHLSHEIMKINILLEDQGTGGAGFRFMYATFLQEAAEILNKSELGDLSRQLMEIGDGWRELSLFAARMGKNRDLGSEKIGQLSRLIMNRAEVEEKFFIKLSKVIKKI